MVKLRQLLTGLALVVLAAAEAVAQGTTRRVTGRVTAQGGGEPLAGASIQVVGTQIGQYSDDQGRFAILVPAGPQQVRVRRIGYKAQVIALGAEQSEINVALERDVLQLEAQVVTGAATTVSRANAATDVAVISGDQLNQVPTPTIENALQGKVAGAQINANSGAPGGGTQVRLRGVTSVYGASDPLYVVDGVLLSNETVQPGLNAVSSSSGGLVSSNQDNGVNRVADLNPADIESIEILKGSSASAIYGAKAANGVIVIRTKQGRAGRTDFNVTQRLGGYRLMSNIKPRKYTLAEAYTQGIARGFDSAFVRSSYERCGGFCNFEEQVFGNEEMAYETNLSMRGGSDRTRYFASGLIKRDPGIAQNTGYDKQSLRLNVSQVANSRVTVNLNTNLVHSITERGLSNNDNVNATPYFVFAQIPSWFDIRPVNGVYPRWRTTANPLQTFSLLRTPSEVWRLIGAIDANVNILSQERQTLDLKAIAGIDQFNQQDNIFSPRELQFEPNDLLPGTNTAQSATNVNGNYSLSLTHGFNPANKSFSATTSIGLQKEYRGFRSSNIVGQNCVSGLQNIDACTVRNSFANRLRTDDLAWYAQEEVLALDERLLLTAAARGQRSSTNGDPSKFYIFPKASASYRLPWLLPQTDELKLRLAVGRAGNQPLYTMQYTPLLSGVYDGSQTVWTGIVRGNPDIRPEISNEIEGGFDLTAFDSRANVAFTVYQKSVSDLILRPTPAPSQGGYTQRFINGGELRNRGTEVALSLTPLQANNYQWVSRTTFARNVGKVMELPRGIPGLDPETGFTIPGSFGYGSYTIREGLAPTVILGPDTLGNEIEYGNTQPDFNMGFSNELSWRRVRLSTLFEWQKGGDIINLTQDTYDAFNNWADREGRDERQALQAAGSTQGNIQDGTFVKLREVTLSYELPQVFTSRLFGSRVRTMRAELSGRNLAVWTDYEGVDPEVSNFGNQNVIRNADLAPFPPSRSFFFSLSVDF